MQDLELADAAVAVAQRALERPRRPLRRLRAVGEQVQQAALLAGLQQPVEARADDLLGRVAEHALDRRALVDDGAVGVEHGDQVAGVLHERAEAGLARRGGGGPRSARRSRARARPASRARRSALCSDARATATRAATTSSRARRRARPGEDVRWRARGQAQALAQLATRRLGGRQQQPRSAPATGRRAARPRATTQPPSSTRHSARPRRRQRRGRSARVDLLARRSRRPAPRPRALRARSRATERSCWRTRPAMRATTSPNRPIEAAMIDEQVDVAAAQLLRSASIAGAISEAHGQQREPQRGQPRLAVGRRLARARASTGAAPRRPTAGRS